MMTYHHMVFMVHSARCPVQMQLGAKIAGIHWWYKARSHPAEMTAGARDDVNVNNQHWLSL